MLAQGDLTQLGMPAVPIQVEIVGNQLAQSTDALCAQRREAIDQIRQRNANVALLVLEPIERCESLGSCRRAG